MKTLIKILSVLAIILLLAYLVVINLPQANIKGKDAEVEVSATNLYEAFSTDEASAEADYIGKVMVVSGIIDETYSDEDDAPVVVLRSSEGDPVAVVTLENSEISKVTKYNEGDNIAIKAMCNGMLMEVTLNKGIIVE